MPGKAKIITVAVLILLGAGLFYYCAALYPVETVVQAKAASPAAASPAVCAPQSKPPEQTASSAAASSPAAPASSQSKPRPRAAAT